VSYLVFLTIAFGVGRCSCLVLFGEFQVDQRELASVINLSSALLLSLVNDLLDLTRLQAGQEVELASHLQGGVVNGSCIV
jgi:signal transduction histidine kinase